MLPKTMANPETVIGFAQRSNPSKTYGIDFKTNRISGMIDETEAVKQAVYCILRTQRYEFLIYTRNHGIELTDLYGGDKRFIIPELQSRITEALMQDDRITSVSGFGFSASGKEYAVSFSVGTVYGGELSIKDEVIL